MGLVKEHNGVKIFVDRNGKFYCDTVNNSEDFNKKKFESDRLSSIEKAIDDTESNKVEDGEIFYDINQYSLLVKKIKIVSRLGSRVFFDDGTDSSNIARKRLYSKEVESIQEFKDLQLLIKEDKELQKQIDVLYKRKREILAESQNKTNRLRSTLVEVK